MHPIAFVNRPITNHRSHRTSTKNIDKNIQSLYVLKSKLHQNQTCHFVNYSNASNNTLVYTGEFPDNLCFCLMVCCYFLGQIKKRFVN